MEYGEVLKERVLNEAKLLISLDACGSPKATLRGLEETLTFINGTSVVKSTIHRDLTLLLPRYNKTLAKKVDKILLKNYNERSARGGAATRKLFKGTTKRTDIKKLNIKSVD